MKNFESRIRKLETILIPEEQTICCINYGLPQGESFIEIEGEKFILPAGKNLKEFINEKAKKFGSVVVCSVYKGDDLSEDKIP